MLHITKAIGVLFLLGFCLAVAVPPAGANSISYEVTGTYDPTAPITAVSAPSAPFTLTFTVDVPLNIVSSTADSFTTTEPLLFSSGALNFTQSANVIFFNTAQSGLFDIEFMVGGTNYTWVLFGQQLFSGSTSNPTLIYGNFTVDSSKSFFWVPGSMSSFPVSGTVGATPEPASLILVGSGLLALARLRRKSGR
jgi:hypothetical protein